MSEESEEVKGLLRRLDILSNAVLELEEKNRVLDGSNRILQAEKAQWVAEKGQQMAIIQSTLQNNNSNQEAYLLENQRLQEEVNRLKRQLKE